MNNTKNNKNMEENNIKLPNFKEHWYESEDKNVLKAYKILEKKLLRGEFVDVKDNIGYLCMYAKKRLIEFLDHLETNRLIEELKPVTSYPSENDFFYPHAYAKNYIADAYLIIQDYDTYWELTYGEVLKEYEYKIIKILSFSIILNYCLPCSGFKLTGHHLASVVGISNAKITKFGKENVKELFKILDSYIEDFIDKEGVDPFHYFKNKYIFPNLTEANLLELKPFIKSKRYDDLRKSYKLTVKGYKKELMEIERFERKDRSLLSLTSKDFSSKKEYNEYYNNLHQETVNSFNQTYICRELGENSKGKKLTIPHTFVPQIIEEAFEGFCNNLLRECENLLRLNRKLPKIGEGWIGETQLYYFLKNIFPKETIINHGRPYWLGRQHLDIYFPERNLAIEYQGLQHDQPVAFFGGEKAFLAQKERDERKSLLCKKHGCKLIYVREGYDVKELEIQINEHLSSE